MDRTVFREIMTFLEGAYGKTFSERSVNQTWKLCALLPDPLVKQAAVRMVDENEPNPSPKKLMERVHAIQYETLQERTIPEIPVAPSNANGRTQLLVDGSDAPRYPGMGLRQILAVRALENSGMSHEAALAEVGKRGNIAQGEAEAEGA